MTQAELARELDLSECMVSKLKTRGMPVDSVPAAEAWRAANLDPILIKAIRRPGLTAESRGERLVSRAHALGARALEDLDHGSMRDFVRHVEQLRAAMQTMTEEQEDAVLLPVEVWDALCGVRGRWSERLRNECTNKH